jgi:hypothetical protein
VMMKRTCTHGLLERHANQTRAPLVCWQWPARKRTSNS